MYTGTKQNNIMLVSSIARKWLQLLPENFQNKWEMVLGSCHWIRQVAAPCGGAWGEI